MDEGDFRQMDACLHGRVRHRVSAALRLLAVAAMVAGCGGGDDAAGKNGRGGGGGGGGRGGGPGGRDGQREQLPTPVETAPVKAGALRREAEVSGVLEPIRTVGVNAQLPGALLSVRVEEGDQVREGQVLAEVDAREVAAQVRSAEASLALAKATAERNEQLFSQKVVTAMEREAAQAALASAQASLDQLRTRLGYATVRSPITGVITEKRVEAGDVVQGQTRLFSVADVSTLVALVQVSELDVMGIRTGAPADVTVDALGGEGFRGVVRRVFPAADTTTRMVPVEVALSGSAARRLKPGFMARVTFGLGERTGVLLAPSSAVVGTGDARAVFVVRDGRAERRAVRLGQVSGEQVEVLDGLAVGDVVVTVGAENLRDGAAVRVVEPVGRAAKT